VTNDDLKVIIRQYIVYILVWDDAVYLYGHLITLWKIEIEIYKATSIQ
jgi:hypothetical protein